MMSAPVVDANQQFEGSTCFLAGLHIKLAECDATEKMLNASGNESKMVEKWRGSSLEAGRPRWLKFWFEGLKA